MPFRNTLEKLIDDLNVSIEGETLLCHTPSHLTTLLKRLEEAYYGVSDHTTSLSSLGDGQLSMPTTSWKATLFKNNYVICKACEEYIPRSGTGRHKHRCPMCLAYTTLELLPGTKIEFVFKDGDYRSGNVFAVVQHWDDLSGLLMLKLYPPERVDPSLMPANLSETLERNKHHWQPCDANNRVITLFYYLDANGRPIADRNCIIIDGQTAVEGSINTTFAMDWYKSSDNPPLGKLMLPNELIVRRSYKVPGEHGYKP